MINATWKQRLIRHAHISRSHHIPMRVRWDFPKNVLGRKLMLRQTMIPNMDWLKKIKGEVYYDEPMALYTSIRVGGPADIFIVPKGLEELKTIFQNVGDVPVFVLGEGTNLLVRDKGIRGIVVSLKDAFPAAKKISICEKPDDTERVLVRAGAGVKMSYLAKHTSRQGLWGLEGLVGVPGSLGGTLVMNAGAEGVEIGPSVRSVSRVTSRGELQRLNRNEMEFQYRKTVFPPGGGVIVEAELELQKGRAVEIQEVVDRNLRKRNLSQPLNIPNSGSIFKNPINDKAGRLIEAAGLKGFSVGGASISVKHANFILNKGDASAKDVLSVIDHVLKKVKEKMGVELETEIVVVGE